MKPIIFFITMLLTAHAISQTCTRELRLVNWVDQYGNDCFIPVTMYKNVNGVWVYVASFQNNVPQTITVEYAGYYKWDFSWCDNSTECVEFFVTEDCGFSEQIEFYLAACPPSDYKLIIDKVLYGYQGHHVCGTCPD